MNSRLILISILHKVYIRLNKYLAIIYYFLDLRNYFDSLEKRISLISYSQKKNTDLTRVCIFASYNKKLSESLKEYLRFIYRSDYKLIFVNNGRTISSDINFLKKYTFLSMDRKNLGRDFGAYRDGFLYLKKHFLINDIDYLCFANDSVQFIPGKYSAKLRKHIKSFERSDSLGLFTHRSIEGNPHFQSFFHIIKKEVFLKYNYTKFWQEFKLINNKLYIVQKGEIEISKKIYNHINKYSLLYSSPKLMFEIERLIRRNNYNQLKKIDLKYLLPKIITNKYPRVRYDSLKKLSQEKLYLNNKLRYKLPYLKEFIDNSNSSHSAAFLYPFFLQCPFIKKDLFRNDSYTVSKATKLYKNCLEISLNTNNVSKTKMLLNQFANDLNFIND